MMGYSVYSVEDKQRLELRDADSFVFVKDGFAWLAILSPILWALYHKLWGMMALLLGFISILYGVLSFFDFSLLQKNIIFFIFHIIFAIEANRLRAWFLEQDGYHLKTFVTGQNRADCQRRFFQDWISEHKTSSCDSVLASNEHP